MEKENTTTKRKWLMEEHRKWIFFRVFESLQSTDSTLWGSSLAVASAFEQEYSRVVSTQTVKNVWKSFAVQKSPTGNGFQSTSSQ